MNTRQLTIVAPVGLERAARGARRVRRALVAVWASYGVLVCAAAVAAALAARLA